VRPLTLLALILTAPGCLSDSGDDRNADLLRRESDRAANPVQRQAEQDRLDFEEP
jgi:hypothetical protein